MCLEKEKCLLIIDDYKGRKEAEILKIEITGTIGIFILAKELGHIESIKEVLNDLQKTNFRISESILNYALKLCNE